MTVPRWVFNARIMWYRVLIYTLNEIDWSVFVTVINMSIFLHWFYFKLLYHSSQSSLLSIVVLFFKVTIRKNGDVSPFGVQFCEAPNSHKYYIVVEFDPQKRLFIRIDTLVQEHAQMHTVLKMYRTERAEPRIWDLVVGSGISVQFRTYLLVLYMFIKYKLNKWGIRKIDSSRCIKYRIWWLFRTIQTFIWWHKKDCKRKI